MSASSVALLAAILFAAHSYAQDDTYTVLSSVVFIRSGERTPTNLGFVPSVLTSLGAQQAYSAGSFFRDRYVYTATPASNANKAPIRRLSANSYDPRQIYILAQDTHSTAATAQAFMQGFYPPYVLNESMAGVVDPSSVLANESYVESPLGGYQYAQIRTADDLDPEYIFLAGSYGCPAYRSATFEYTRSPEFDEIQNSSKSFYESLNAGSLDDLIPSQSKDYLNAYAIYEYLDYQATHNASVAATLDTPTDRENNITDLDRLRFLADAQQFAFLGNTTARNNLSTPSTGLPGLAGGAAGSISTIAGNTLLAKVLAQLQSSIDSGGRYYKLSLLAGDFQPLLSLFAITGLSDLNSNKFRGIPEFASTAVFELFTYSSNLSYPVSTDDLWVRFYFRNGTEEQPDQLAFQSYPIFSHGPSETDMRWSDFQAEASAVAMDKVGDWCEACAAESVFCPAFNATLFEAAAANANASASSSQKHPISPGVSGVLGAVVALIAAALIFALAMLVGGVRLHRKQTLQAGGFRGEAKFTPDRDVEVSGTGGAGAGAGKNGAVVFGREAPAGQEVGGSVVDGGHARVGSWEMKEPASQLPPRSDRMRFSFEDDGDEDYRRAIDPFADPVRPKEL